MTRALDPAIWTPENYLELELNSEVRNEYRDGTIVPMTGGTPDHNEIVLNLASLLKSALRGQTYRVLAADQRLWIPQRNLYTYPDVMVVEKPLQLQSGRTDTLTNPCLLAEVLSRSTQDYDRGEKFTAYRTIAHFYDYLLIDQYRIHVEHYVRTSSSQWLFSEYEDPEVTLSLKGLGIQIDIRDLYENIEFQSTESQQ
ncbi:MAG: Uma2 family endonuclease [Synechococcaceae cyanobacterium SM2_3_1]|nr:Uma2 family endonuclease [Synechococcaceae cyanobacterium SM2_3_1]